MMPVLTAEFAASASAAASKPDSVPDEDLTPRRTTRRKALSMLMEEIGEFTDLLVLARRLTLGTDKVQDPGAGLCKEGTESFMTSGRLCPTTTKSRSRHPRSETPEETLAGEAAICKWVLGLVGGDLEDFSAAGLLKKIPVIQKERDAWRKQFRDLCKTHHRSDYLNMERMRETFPQLGLKPFEEQVHLNWTISFPRSALGGMPLDEWTDTVRTQIMTALREVAGPDAKVDDKVARFPREYASVGWNAVMEDD